MQAAAYDKTSDVQSRDYLNGLVESKTVSIRRITTDRYGRTVAELFLNGINVGQELVRGSHAELYRKYAEQCAWSRWFATHLHLLQSAS